MLCCRSLWIHLFWNILGFRGLNVCIFPGQGSFQPLSLWISFLSLSWDELHIWWLTWCIPQFHLLTLFFLYFCSSKWMNSTFLSLSLLILSSTWFSLFILSFEFLLSVIIFFSSMICLVPSYIFSLLTFLHGSHTVLLASVSIFITIILSC